MTADPASTGVPEPDDDLRSGKYVSGAGHRFSNALLYREGGHEAQRQLTPPYVLDPVRAALGGSIGLDPCTEPDNPTGVGAQVRGRGVAGPACRAAHPVAHRHPNLAPGHEHSVDGVLHQGPREVRRAQSKPSPGSRIASKRPAGVEHGPCSALGRVVPLTREHR